MATILKHRADYRTYLFSQKFNQIAAAAKSLQSCPTLCDPIDGSPPGSPVPGILQARTLEWVAISFSNAWKWKVKVKSLSRVLLLVTPCTAAHQAPPSMGFSRQEYWSGVPLPSLNQIALHAKSLQSYPTLCDPMDKTHQASLSMRFSRQEYWSEFPCLPPGIFPTSYQTRISYISCIVRWVLYH